MSKSKSATLAKTTSSSRWLKRQHSDIYTRQAKDEGYRSRAVYKLLEIQQKDRLLTPGMTIIDLGAAPGGWSQLAVEKVGKSGRVIALDILPMDTIEGVHFLQGDFREETVLNQLLDCLENKKVDLVISDMAPNLSGMAVIDQPRAILLAELALDLSTMVLKKDGNLLVKLFQGESFQAYWAMLKERFKSVSVRKPKASRSESREVYLLAKGYTT